MGKMVRLQRLAGGLITMFLVSAMWVGCASALDVGESEFYGYTWVRYTYEQEEGGEGGNEFTIPRVYLRWKMKLDEKVDASVTLQMENKQYAQSKYNVTEEANESIADWNTVVKYAYVDLKQWPSEGKVRIGLQPIYFGMIDTWNYPLIEGSLEDKQQVLAAADLGAGVVGLLPAGFGEYALAVYNGTGYKHIEDNDAKAVCGSVSIIPAAGVTLRASVYTGKKNEDEEDVKRYAAVAQFVQGDFTGFLEYLLSEDGDIDGKGYSVFADYSVTEKLAIAGRFDKWDADDSEAGDKIERYIAGFNYDLAKNVLLQVNYQREDEEAGSGADIWKVQTKFSW